MQLRTDSVGPSLSKWGKAHILSKTDEPSLQPLEHRLLLVLQRIYRRWASMRLHHLASWVKEWQMEEMYAGVPASGADMAWAGTALDCEEACIENAEWLMGLLDVWKCFDQLVPMLLQTIAALAGMPTKVWWAYVRLMRQVQVINVLTLGVGKPYRKRCSIPQGCPLSMTLLALATVPWIKLMRLQNTVIPRSRADDLSLWA